MTDNSHAKFINSTVKVISNLPKDSCKSDIQNICNWVSDRLGVNINQLDMLDKLYYDVLASDENYDKQSFHSIVEFIREIFEKYEFLRIHLLKCYYNKYMDDKSGIILEVPDLYFDKYKDFLIENNFHIVDGMVCDKGFILFFYHKLFLCKYVGLYVKFFNN